MNIKKLELFKSVDGSTGNLTTVHENDNFYIAGDGYRGAILFKNFTKDIINNFEGSMYYMTNYIVSELENKEYSFTINKKEVLEGLKDIYVKTRDTYKSMTGKTIRKDKLYVKITLDFKNNCITFSIKEISNTLGSESFISHVVDLNDRIQEDNFTINLNLKFFEEHLNFFKEKDIKIYYRGSMCPIFSEGLTTMAALLPIREIE